MSVFLEGDHVDYVGDGVDGIPPARGEIVAVAGQNAVHVHWFDGERIGKIDMVSKWDLEKSPSDATLTAPTITAHSVRRVMNVEGDVGVLNFLAAAKQTDSWESVAREALGYVEGRLRVDPSMELVYEQLRPDEVDQVITLAARTILTQAYGG